jgi:5-methylcytosine-specific restriction endonuclease McrA
MRAVKVIRPDGTAWCDFHLKWEPVGDFGKFTKQSMNGPIHTLNPRCKLAYQKSRDQLKAVDPASSSIIGRAKDFAGDISKAVGVTVSYHWVLNELHWIGFIPLLRASIGPGGSCLNCAQHWDEPKQYHLAHHIPAPRLTDWAYQHARNLRLACPGCNSTQGSQPSDVSYLLQEHRKWMTEHQWATYAGTQGWPPYDPSMGDIPITLLADGPVDHNGNPVLDLWGER